MKVYAQIVEVNGRLVLLPMDDGTLEDRYCRTINAGLAVAQQLHATWGAADPEAMAEFRAIGDAAAALVETIDTFKTAAVQSQARRVAAGGGPS